MDPKRYILGLDLHGTLLEPGEILRPELVPALIAGLRRLRGRVALFLCTGNDLEFVDRKIPAPLLAEFDGYVLETGCSWSPDRKRELVLTTAEEQALIKKLEAELQARRLPEVNYFAHRLTTVSLFCDRPKEFYAKVSAAVAELGVASQVLVTYSSVAVDILPAGYNKLIGLRRVAEGRLTIGVADSMNDAALLEAADYALAPANLAPELSARLTSLGRPAAGLASLAGLDRSVVGVAAQPETRGVIEILDFLDRSL